MRPPLREFPEFDRSRLKIEPLEKRVNDLDLSRILPLEPVPVSEPVFQEVASRMRTAREKGGAVILMMGAHLVRDGVQRYLIDMMEEGYISALSMNGAGVVHDYEFSLIGKTTECVSRYIKEGYFGLWEETGKINDILHEGVKAHRGFGEAVGKAIWEGAFPQKNTSLLASGYRLKIPVTVHVGIGCDIIHEFPNCDGAVTGQTSYTDFLRLAHVMTSLENGVVMNFGSAVMAPEVYLKALSMVRNLARQQGKTIKRFTTLVCDLVDLPKNYRLEPEKSSPFYYFRPFKTMLVRTVADGGESFYVKGRHRDTIPMLWSALKAR
jgi:hypothetical protein